MKKIIGTIWVCIIIMIIPSCKTTSGWKMVWHDEFNQKNSFDENSWSKVKRGHSDWDRHMSDFDSCFAMRKGNLVLRGIVNYSLPTDTAPYITGGVLSKGKVGFSEGRVSVRARFHGATGAWPAIWMLPENEGWPDGGEIDIMERLNNNTIAYQTVHSYYTYKLGINDPKHGGIGPINRDDYNVYSVEMYRDSLVFYINDSRTFSYPRIKTDKKGQFPFTDKKFYLLIDMQLGGSWVGRVDKNDLPVEMEVDWVRFYKKKP
jgi:beta-glucanase (GH16 family)